jgi:hypothetical protein
MFTSCFIETLESRRLFNVSATTLAGPLTKGASWAYDLSVAGTRQSTETHKVFGPATISGGQRTTRVDSTHTPVVSGIPQLAEHSFVTLDNTSGLREYLHQADTRVAIPGGGTLTPLAITATFTPFAVRLPPSMTAGKTYRYAWSAKIATVSNLAHIASTKSVTTTFQIKLMSETRTSIIVPAGSYWAYRLLLTDTLTSDGRTTTHRVQQWVAPSVGLVQEKSTLDDGRISLTQLRSWSAGTAAAIPAVPTPVLASLFSTTFIGPVQRDGSSVVEDVTAQ